MTTKKRIVIIGATSAIAEQCARQWAQQGPVEIILLGRNQRRLDIVAADLLVRSPTLEIKIVIANFIDPESIKITAAALFEKGAIDIALIAHGSLPEQIDCQNDLGLCRQTLEVNAISPVLYAEALAGQMAKLNRGTIALISSVAGDRGRKSNYVYGSAKGLVTRYAQGLQHRFAGSGVHITLIKPGPTGTPMTAGMKGNFSSPENVAKKITEGIENQKFVIYAPEKWRLIMMVIRHLPSFIFNKLNI